MELRDKYQKAAFKGSRAAELADSDSWNKDIVPQLERRLDSYVQSLRARLSNEDYHNVIGKITELEFLINLPENLKRSGLNAVAKMDEL